MQRLALWVMFLSGIVLGTLVTQRPWAESADAAPATTKIECFAFDPQEGEAPRAQVYLLNQAAGSSTTNGNVRWYDAGGNKIEVDTVSGLGAGQMQKFEADNDNAVRSLAVIKNGLGQGYARQNVNFNDSYVNVTCLRTVS